MTNLFGGAVIPFWFYPPALRNIAKLFPFRFITFEPIAIYLGQTADAEIFSVIGAQILWLTAVYLLGRLLWSKAEKLVIVQGG